MLADADVFWKWPSVYDAISVIGLLLAVVSIWLALALAKKQLRADLKKSADEAVRRFALQSWAHDLSDASRFVREAKRALEDKNWEYGRLRLDDATSLFARIAGSSLATPETRTEIAAYLVEIRLLNEKVLVHRRSKNNRGHMPVDELAKLTPLIQGLERMRSEVRS